MDVWRWGVKMTKKPVSYLNKTFRLFNRILYSRITFQMHFYLICCSWPGKEEQKTDCLSISPLCAQNETKHDKPRRRNKQWDNHSKKYGWEIGAQGKCDLACQPADGLTCGLTESRRQSVFVPPASMMRLWSLRCCVGKGRRIEMIKSMG